MKIFVLGNIASGKTTLIEKILERYTLKYLSIDNLRKKWGDGSFSGEYLAWSKFFDELEKKENEKELKIFEFTGTGFQKYPVKEILKSQSGQTLVILLQVSLETVKVRLENKKWDAPYPWNIPAKQIVSEINEEINLDIKELFWDLNNSKFILIKENDDIKKKLIEIYNIIQEIDLREIKNDNKS